MLEAGLQKKIEETLFSLIRQWRKSEADHLSRGPKFKIGDLVKSVRTYDTVHAIVDVRMIGASGWYYGVAELNVDGSQGEPFYWFPESNFFS